MASITTFSRLEPEPLRPDVTAGASAPVQDPLWLLARQWQVGEFAGHDGGTPVRGALARRRRTTDALRRRPDPARHRRCRRRGSTPLAAPLETLIERAGAPLPSTPDVRRGSAPGRRHRAARSCALLALQTTSRDYRPDFCARSRCRMPTDEQLAALDPATAAYARLHAGRSLDGRRLRAELAGRDLPRLDRRHRPGDRRRGPRRPAPTGCAWLATLFDDADPRRDVLAADPVRAHGLVGRPASADPFGETTLTAHRYDSDTLDWYEFDVNGEVNLGTTPAEAGPGGHPHGHAGAGDRARPARPPLLGVRGRSAQPRRAPAGRDGPRPGAADRDPQRGSATTGSSSASSCPSATGSSSRRRSWSPTPSACAPCCARTAATVTSGRWGLFRHAMPVDRRRARRRADQQPALPRAAAGAAADRAGRRAGRAGPRRAGEPRLGDRADASSRRCRSASTLSDARPADPPGDPDVAPDYQLAQGHHRTGSRCCRCASGPDEQVVLARGSVLDVTGGRRARRAASPRCSAGGPDGPLLIPEEEVPERRPRRPAALPGGPVGRRHPARLGGPPDEGEHGLPPSGVRYDYLVE